MKKTLSITLIVCLIFNLIIFPTFNNNTYKAATFTEISPNLITNGGFEATTQKTSSKWENRIEPDTWSIWIPTGTPIVKVDNSVYNGGSKSALVNAAGASRVDISKKVPVNAGKIYILKFWVKTENISTTSSSGGVFARTQFYNASNVKVSDGPATRKLLGTNDWTLMELSIPVPSNVTNLMVELFLETAKGKVWFDDVELYETDKIVVDFKLSQSTVSLSKDQSVTLIPSFTPDNVPDKSIQWESLNSDIASISEDGTITGKAYGFTTIKGKMNYNDNMVQCLVTVEPSDVNLSYETLRLKWYERLTGNSKYNFQDSDIVNSVNSVVDKVTNLSSTGFWDTMNKTSNRTFLWSDIASTTVSADITSNFSRIKTMALAYSFKGSSLYKNTALKNDIVSALNWMYTNRYNENMKFYNNWWDWEIGTPQPLNDILVLMYDDLTSDQINNYMKTIDKFASDPTKAAYNGMEMTGANRVDKALVAALRGVIGKNSIRIFQARDSISQVLLYVDKGDGFYTDGSFIQHNYIPYIGSYGGVLVSSLSNILFVLKDSAWEVADPNFKNVYDWIMNSYEPLIYKGAIMDMVSGRAISREAYADHKNGKGMILNLLRLSEGLPNEKALIVKSMIKELIQSDSTFTNYYDGLNLNDIMKQQAGF